MTRYDFICAGCGSDKITVEASVQWNVDEQEWEICNIYNHDRGFCPDCEFEERATRVEINPESKS